MTGETSQTVADVRFVDCSIATANGWMGSDVGVAVSDGKIVSVGSVGSLPEAHREVRLDGNVLVPGVIDDHIHTRTPGHEYKEDWKTATQSAAAGGVTTVIAMPNTDPIVDRVDRVESVYETAATDACVDYLTHVVVTSDNLDRIPALAEADIGGFKVFLGITFGDIEAPTDGELHAAMGAIADTDCRLGFHEENDEIRAYLEAEFRREGKNAAIYHNRSRPPLAEVEAVSRVCLFADDTGCPVHMFHLSSGSAAETLRDWRHRGVDATAETCPHYLWFTEDVVRERGTVARVQPPLRTADERARLWSVGIDGGAVDCIATDHAPHTDEEKGVGDPDKSVWETPGGFVGLETQVPAMLTFVAEGRLTLPEWVRLHSTRPAQIWGLYPKKGSLQPGADADFTVVDPDREWTLDRTTLRSKSTATPFDGERFRGAVSKTVVRGEIVYDGETVTGTNGYGELATGD
ncbi:dihydroorotase [Salinigranum sp. GCM10025319]|uniref:dihydroorotase n=1 Tax=Salinigranum sp. GCM10025319 TaxID=3252687 RepID=UPI00361877F3